jgi:hypothetical protein
MVATGNVAGSFMTACSTTVVVPLTAVVLYSFAATATQTVIVVAVGAVAASFIARISPVVTVSGSGQVNATFEGAMSPVAYIPTTGAVIAQFNAVAGVGVGSISLSANAAVSFSASSTPIVYLTASGSINAQFGAVSNGSVVISTAGNVSTAFAATIAAIELPPAFGSELVVTRLYAGWQSFELNTGWVAKSLSQPIQAAEPWVSWYAGVLRAPLVLQETR